MMGQFTYAQRLAQRLTKELGPYGYEIGEGSFKQIVISFPDHPNVKHIITSDACDTFWSNLLAMLQIQLEESVVVEFKHNDVTVCCAEYMMVPKFKTPVLN